MILIPWMNFLFCVRNVASLQHRSRRWWLWPYLLIEHSYTNLRWIFCLRFLLFLDIMQYRWVVIHQRFGTAYWCHLQGSGSMFEHSRWHGSYLYLSPDIKEPCFSLQSESPSRKRRRVSRGGHHQILELSAPTPTPSPHSRSPWDHAMTSHRRSPRLQPSTRNRGRWEKEASS